MGTEHSSCSNDNGKSVHLISAEVPVAENISSKQYSWPGVVRVTGIPEHVVKIFRRHAWNMQYAVTVM